MDLESTTNAVYSLNYHLIFVVKYRRKVLSQERVKLLKTMIYKQTDDFNINIKEMETDKDHIHILFSSKPSLKITNFIKKVKGVSSRVLRLKYPELLREVHQKHL
jgi:putative transposase